MDFAQNLVSKRECWTVKHQHVHKMSVAEMRLLHWIFGHTRNDKIRNDDIRGKVGVAEIEEKIRENWLRWFGHVKQRPTDALEPRLPERDRIGFSRKAQEGRFGFLGCADSRW